jgi:hypothetical protein
MLWRSCMRYELSLINSVRVAGALNLPGKSPDIGARDHQATISVTYPCQPHYLIGPEMQLACAGGYGSPAHTSVFVPVSASA